MSPTSVAVSVVFDHDEPLVLSRESPMLKDAEYLVSKEPREVLVAPLRWEPDGAGTIAVIGHQGDGIFGDRDVRLLRGVADLTSLALGNARRISELERFHELVAGLDAAFWEASIPDLRFTFVAGAVRDLLGGDTESWPEEARTWGSHIYERDREDAMAALLRSDRERGRRGVRVPRHERRRRTSMDPRPGARDPRPRRDPHDPPRTDGRRHGAQASGASAARERAEVLRRVQA